MEQAPYMHVAACQPKCSHPGLTHFLDNQGTCQPAGSQTFSLHYPIAFYAPIWCVYVTAFPIASGIPIMPGMPAQPGVTTMLGQEEINS